MKSDWRILLLVALAGLGLTQCGKGPEPEATPPRPVYTMTVTEPKETVERSFSGLVASAEGTNLAFEVGGRIVEVIAEEGVSYKAGDVLARMDSSEYVNQLNGARAQLTEAEQTLRRTQQLFESGNASKSQLESAIAREKSARSSFKSSEKRVNDTVLKMPYAGVISTVDIDPEQVVNGGQPVMTIQGEGGMEFEVGIPAELVRFVKVKDKATISLGSLPETEFPAVVKSVTPQATENTTYPVVLKFEEADPRLREGMDGEAQLVLPNQNGKVILVPAVAVAARPDDTQFVWVVDPIKGSDRGLVNQRNVKTGKLRANDMIEVPEGLMAGDQVVTRGVHRLEEGQEVRLQTEE